MIMPLMVFEWTGPQFTNIRRPVLSWVTVRCVAVYPFAVSRWPFSDITEDGNPWGPIPEVSFGG